MRWRPMAPADAAIAAELANSVHLAYPEDPVVFAERLRLYPAGCHVLMGVGDALHGYLISHPWRLAAPPPLDSPLGALPDRPDCYYLHDLALGADARGSGHAGEAVDLVVGMARRCGFNAIALVAVGDAHGFWTRNGFDLYGDGRIDPGKGYGSEARALVRRL